MGDDLSFEGSLIVVLRAPKRTRPGLVLAAALLTALVSAGICAGAILAPAPTAAVPLIVATCIGGPIFAGWEAPSALAYARANRAGRTALAQLRRSLRQLPEIEHPLGL